MSNPRRPSLRPSGAKRWLSCKASPGLISRLVGVPEDSGSYANEGTKAHELAAACLLKGWDGELFDDKEMLGHVRGYYDLVVGHAKGNVIAVEQPLPLWYDPASPPGTTDAIIVQEDGKRVFIDDLKYGAGVSIQAKQNPQLAIYARSAMEYYGETYPFTDSTLVTLCIYQPRIVGEEPVRLWALSYKELKAFCAEIETTAHSILADPFNQPYAPSDEACQFCPAQAVCKARAEYLLGELPLNDAEELLESQSPPPELPSPELLTLEQLAKVVGVSKHLVKWLNDCKEHGEKLLTEGKPFPGFKLVAGKSNRAWTDEADAEKFLRGMFRREAIYTEKLVSPTQAEKMMNAKTTRDRSWTRFAELVTKPVGGPSMVPQDDPREAIVPGAQPQEEFVDESLL